jgi:hypothetical protein
VVAWISSKIRECDCVASRTISSGVLQWAQVTKRTLSSAISSGAPQRWQSTGMIFMVVILRNGL